MPFSQCSRPFTTPYWRASDGSQADPSEIPAGSCVTSAAPAPTPSESSCSTSAGMHNAGCAGTNPS